MQTREQFGKVNKALRKQGFIPAELYGHGIPNIHLSVDAKEFRKIFREAGENTVIQLMIGDKRYPALIHEVRENYVSGGVDHIDFYQVRMDEKIKAHVPIEFTGDAPAVKAFGGILNKSMLEIEAEALPVDLPRRFTVDLSSLAELNQSIYVKDIAIPEKVKIFVGPDAVVATVMPPLKEEEIAPQPAPDVSEVKVETEEKKAEREKEKTETAKSEKPQ